MSKHKALEDMVPPKDPTYSPKWAKDDEFWSAPKTDPATFAEDADLLDNPQFSMPAATADRHIHIHLHKRPV